MENPDGAHGVITCCVKDEAHLWGQQGPCWCYRAVAGCEAVQQGVQGWPAVLQDGNAHAGGHGLRKLAQQLGATPEETQPHSKRTSDVVGVVTLVAAMVQTARLCVRLG